MRHEENAKHEVRGEREIKRDRAGSPETGSFTEYTQRDEARRQEKHEKLPY
jgi:hypothetical protein